MLDYTELKDKGGLEEWPGFDELPFAKTLEGDPVQSGRFDVGGFGTRTMAGVWACTPGSFAYTYPGDEICTLLEGKIRLVAEDGEAHEYVAGRHLLQQQGRSVELDGHRAGAQDLSHSRPGLRRTRTLARASSSPDPPGRPGRSAQAQRSMATAT